ncbi:chromate transporter [Paenibacillus sp. 481]|uniref:chromate transporter n=1 Tax=Paenibacillus sp. 481 TaxID=2835869 RepID=UPI001E41AD03|nr:chromate transporter [Paenibacillus sp. 481]
MKIRSTVTLLLQLFLTFLKISPTTFGGGYAILPVIDREVTVRRAWLSLDEMSEMTALAGAAPGGIAVNIAALVGYRLAGIAGLFAAVVGITLPTLAVMLLICFGAAEVRDNSYAQAALAGIKPAVAALIVFAAIRLGQRTLRHSFAWATTITFALLLLWTNVHPLIVLALGAAAGLAAQRFNLRPLHPSGPAGTTSAHTRRQPQPDQQRAQRHGQAADRRKRAGA